jgi:hypothetical protein
LLARDAVVDAVQVDAFDLADAAVEVDLVDR